MSRLAISANRPFGSGGPHGRRDEALIGQGVEYYINTGAAGVGEDLIGEIRSARVVDVLHTHPAQRRAFVGAGRGEDGRTALLCPLDRGQSDTAAGGVDEHPVTGPQLRPVEREPDRQRRSGYGRRLYRAAARRAPAPAAGPAR